MTKIYKIGMIDALKARHEAGDMLSLIQLF